jgi:hypothetical protein
MERLDLELKLLKSALDDDLGPVAGRPGPASQPAAQQGG